MASFWRWLRKHKPEPPAPKPQADDEHGAEEAPQPQGAIRLPQEPFVFECRDCGKTFEVRRRRATCPECDSQNVEILSE